MDTVANTELQLQLARITLALELQLHDARNDLLRMRLALTKKELETIVAEINKALEP